MSVNAELHATAPGTVPRLLAYARSLGATVHDVVQAALSRALQECLPRRTIRQQRDVVIGSIVDTRADAQVDLSNSLERIWPTTKSVADPRKRPAWLN